jgi:hypothetical protein
MGSVVVKLHKAIPLLAFTAYSTPSSEPMYTTLPLVDMLGDALIRPNVTNVHNTTPELASSA